MAGRKVVKKQKEKMKERKAYTNMQQNVRAFGKKSIFRVIAKCNCRKNEAQQHIGRHTHGDTHDKKKGVKKSKWNELKKNFLGVPGQTRHESIAALENSLTAV